MPDYLVSVPASVSVNVKAESEEAITEAMVAEAVLDQHSKYITLDARMIDMAAFTVLGEA